MRYIIYGALLIFGLKYGLTYLGSEEFQRYGDEHQAQWTCRVNNLMGQLNITMSRYDEALRWFTPVLKRCPKTSMSEEALFRIAVCLENSGRRAEAMETYKKFAETYKGTPRARTALKAADFLAGNSGL